MSSVSRQIVETSWDMLATLDADEGYQARELLDVQTAHGGVMLSCDSAGVRHVLIPIGPHEPVEPDMSSQGVQLVKTRVTDQDTRRDFLDIRCPDPRLHRVFNQIASSMLDVIAVSEEPPAQVCAGVLKSWRALLRRAAKPLTHSALCGLFGELWQLAELCEHDPRAIEYWRGPDNHPQDFVSARGAFELKTTLRNPVRRVSINGIDQLDEELHPFLTLVVISAALDSTGTNIPGLVDRIVAHGVERDSVLDRLAKAGVQDEDLAEVASLRLRVVSQTGYAITPEFPHLTPRSFSPALTPGILNLRYDLELSGASTFVLSESELREQQRQLLGAE